MNKNKLTRSFYIILVPVILVVILINSGFLQARVPAVSVDGRGFNVAQFNYYYFTAYNQFVEANFDEQDNGPFDQNTALRDQVREDGTTWRDYFTGLAQERLAEVIYYSTRAEAEGYVFSEEELQPVQDQLDAIETARVEKGITLDNYLVAYWGVGMSKDIYTAELTRTVQADAYRAHLTATAQVSGSEIAAWVQENAPDSYAAANLRLIVLDAAADRFTGQVGPQQLTDLNAKLERLQARYEADPAAFADLAAAFCDEKALAEARGVLTNATRDDLPDAVAAWAFSGDRQPGDTAALLDEAAGQAYLVILDGWGSDAAELTAAAALQVQHTAEDLAQAQAGTEVTHNALGWRLVGR